MWSKFWKWWEDAPLYLRIPTSILIGIAGLFGVYLAIMILLVWPIQYLRWWTVIYWILLAVIVILEIARYQDRNGR